MKGLHWHVKLRGISLCLAPGQPAFSVSAVQSEPGRALQATSVHLSIRAARWTSDAAGSSGMDVKVGRGGASDAEFYCKMSTRNAPVVLLFSWLWTATEIAEIYSVFVDTLLIKCPKSALQHQYFCPGVWKPIVKFMIQWVIRNYAKMKCSYCTIHEKRTNERIKHNKLADCHY